MCVCVRVPVSREGENALSHQWHFPVNLHTNFQFQRDLLAKQPFLCTHLHNSLVNNEIPRKLEQRYASVLFLFFEYVQ